MAKLYILDVREPSEFQAGHVPNAINFPLSKLSAGGGEILATIPQNAEVIVYCNSGNRSGLAKSILENIDYMHVTNGINQSKVMKTIRS